MNQASMFFNAILLMAGLGWYTMASQPPAAVPVKAHAAKAAPAKAAPAKPAQPRSTRVPLVAWGEAPVQD